MLSESGCRFCGGVGVHYAPYTVVVEVPYELNEKNALKPVLREFAVCSKCLYGKEHKAFMRESERRAKDTWNKVLRAGTGGQ